VNQKPPKNVAATANWTRDLRRLSKASLLVHLLNRLFLFHLPKRRQFSFFSEVDSQLYSESQARNTIDSTFAFINIAENNSVLFTATTILLVFVSEISFITWNVVGNYSG